MPPASSTTFHLSDFNYTLPAELIAQYPLPQRDASRMMVLNRNKQTITHHVFSDLSLFLKPHDLLVLNNTQVLPVRLLGHREGHTGQVEILLQYPEPTDDTHWTCLMRPARRLKPGTMVVIGDSTSRVEVLEQGELGHGQVQIHLKDADTIAEWLQQFGQMPIPPYLNRDAEEADKSTYQTVFAKVPGAQAAPTAGLHFTPEVFTQLQAKGVPTAEVTLSVSAGTFRPVLDEAIEQHRMDPEWYNLPATTAQALGACRAQSGRVVAIGTTVAKTLETVASHHQGNIVEEAAWSELFIRPGFQFQAVDVLLTNFHLPKSTLMMLVSAFAGYDLIMDAYRQAVEQRYRFYSYGDCMLIV